MLAARAALQVVFVNTSLKCSIVPAPPDAITGMLTLLLTSLVTSIENPDLVPSAFIDVRSISPAPCLSALMAQSTAFYDVGVLPAFM